jgi:predicted aspartyl protease
MRSWATALVLISVFVPALAWAAIYYWVDDQGTQNYTTRLESIPESYRSNVQVLSLPTTPSAPLELQPSALQKGPAKIPFTPGSPVTLSAKINGAGPIILILDTGSDRTLIRPSALSKVGISTENARRMVLRGVTGMSYADAVWVNSVEVEEARVGPFLVVIYDVDLKEADGLLGRDFLANFNLTINSKEGIVTLIPN